MYSSSLQEFAVVVLAAGASSRFGSASKLDAQWRDRPLLTHLLDTVLGLDFGDVVIVTGGDHRQRLRKHIVDRNIREAVNAKASDGMGTSIATGIKALLDKRRAVFICLADMPLIHANDFHRLACAMHSPASICRPVFDGRPGHPVLFGANHSQTLSELSGDQGAARIIGLHRDQLILVPVRNPGVVLDYDTQHDFAARP